jgi:hypothetical protein
MSGKTGRKFRDDFFKSASVALINAHGGHFDVRKIDEIERRVIAASKNFIK